VEVAVHYEPAMWVGGDYCDVWPLEDGRIAFAVGDVSGKGLPAALVMTNLQAALRTTLSFCRDLPEVMGRLSRHLEAHLPEGMFVTMVLGLLEGREGMDDGREGLLEFVNAGHILPMLRSPAGEVTELGTPRNPPLGIASGTYEMESLRLPAGAGLVVVTDGITECLSPAGEEFGVEGLRKTLAAATRGIAPADAAASGVAATAPASGAASGGPPDGPPGGPPGGQDLLSAVTRAMAGFRQTLPQHDDVTVLAIVRK
jgi:phosphoserine phosphatase RsbU/P